MYLANFTALPEGRSRSIRIWKNGNKKDFKKNKQKKVLRTAEVAKAVRSSSFGQQGAQPAGIQAAQSEPPQAERPVVVVQTQPSQQQNDRGSVGTLHAHSQRLAEVLLVSASADQELHQLEGAPPLADLTAEESVVTTVPT